MKRDKARTFVSDHRRPFIVGGAHLLLIMVLWVAWRPIRTVRKHKVIKVGLVSMSAGGTSKSSPSKQHKPTPALKQRSRPTPTKKSTHKQPGKTSTKTPVRKTKKTSWKARSVEDIRREIEQSSTHKSTPRRKTPTRKSLDVSHLRNKLNDQLSVGAVATTLRGEPTAVSSDYLSRLHGVIYQTWRQPTRAEAGAGDFAVVIRLEIAKDGQVTSSSRIRRSKNVIMDQSVNLLLKQLNKVPPLPREYEGDTLRVDITLRLR